MAEPQTTVGKQNAARIMVSRRIGRAIPLLTVGICRDCRLEQKVSLKDWRRATGPRCSGCGGMLDRKHGPRKRGPGRVRGERTPKAKLTADKVREIRGRYKQGCPMNGVRPLAREYGMDPSSMRSIVTGRSWKHI